MRRDAPRDATDPIAAVRATLARRQAAVVTAILDGTPTPPGFTRGALRTAFDVVNHKRAALARGRATRARRRLWTRFTHWLRPPGSSPSE